MGKVCKNKDSGVEVTTQLRSGDETAVVAAGSPYYQDFVLDSHCHVQANDCFIYSGGTLGAYHRAILSLTSIF